MKWRAFLAVGTVAGAFTLGAMLSPIGNTEATENYSPAGMKAPVVQTANDENVPQAGKAEFSCPMTGEQMGSRAGMWMAGGMQGEIAKALGMSVDEFQAARQDGKTVADLAEEKGMNTADLAAQIIESRKTVLDQLVKDGKLTQEQVDAMLENMETRMEQAMNGGNIGPMMHRRGMGMGNGMRWNSDSNKQF